MCIRDRTKAALQAKKVRGELTGTAPYGFRCDDGVNLVKDSVEQEVLVRVHQLKSEGLSLRAIAARLESLGFRARGTGWHPQTIKNILGGAA